MSLNSELVERLERKVYRQGIGARRNFFIAKDFVIVDMYKNHLFGIKPTGIAKCKTNSSQA